MKLKALLIAAIAPAVAAGWCAGTACAAPQTLDSTAAVVNNDIILTSELDSATAMVIANAKRQNVQLDGLRARKAAMEHLITNSLVLQMAKDRGIELTDMQLDQAVNEMASRNRTTPDKILESMAPGQSRAAQRQAFKSEYLINEFRRSGVRSRISISDAEVESLAKQLKTRGSIEPKYHIGQIIIPLSTNPTEAEYNRAQADARAVRAEIKSGAPFASVAARYSAGNTASSASDLGYVPETQVPMPFVPALVKAKPGDLIGPIRSPVGLHFIQLFDVSRDAVQPIRTYDAAHILLKPSVILSDESARAQLLKIKSEIASGELTFAQAARQYSEDAGSASNGGELGYNVPGTYDPAFAAGMVALNPGQISDPVRSSFGWHLIYLKDVKTDTNSDAAYKARAREILYERAFREQAGLWEQQLRDSSYVHITDPELVSSGIDMEHEKQLNN